jgi:hypothetical protein
MLKNRKQIASQDIQIILIMILSNIFNKITLLVRIYVIMLLPIHSINNIKRHLFCLITYCAIRYFSVYIDQGMVLFLFFFSSIVGASACSITCISMRR